MCLLKFFQLFEFLLLFGYQNIVNLRVRALVDWLHLLRFRSSASVLSSRVVFICFVCSSRIGLTLAFWSSARFSSLLSHCVLLMDGWAYFHFSSEKPIWD